MKIDQITNSLTGSIGTITLNISDALTRRGIVNRIYISSGPAVTSNIINYSNPLANKCAALKSKITGRYGFNNIYATKELIKYLDKSKPNLILFHNIHGHDFNLNHLFSYLSSRNIRVIWLFHDCWAFTGGCVHPGTCNNWKSKCTHCPQIKKFSFFMDTSSNNFIDKLNIANLHNIETIITPSNWLNTMVRESIFKNKKIITIFNGIDTSIFNINKNKANKIKYLEGKKILVTCANKLTENKGLSYYIKLSSMLENDYHILVIGTIEENISLPSNMSSLGTIADKKELSAIYSSCYAFVNLTQADTLPTVNLEAQACGLPVICNDVGGCKDTLVPGYSKLIPFNDLAKCLKEIKSLKVSNAVKQMLHEYIDLHFNKTTQSNLLINILLKHCQDTTNNNYQ